MNSKKVTKKDWEKFYSKVGKLNKKDLKEHKRVFKEYFKTIKKYLKKDSEILEIACGLGKLLTILSKMINNKIIATDLEDSMLKICKWNIKSFGEIKNIKFVKLEKISKYVVFGLPYQTKRNQVIWDKSPYEIYRKKWDYNKWEKFLSKHFKLKEIFHFNVGSKTSCGDNLMGVISSKENKL